MMYLDDDLAVHMKARGLPEPVPEYRFHHSRRWQFDWAYPDLKIAIEKEGVVYPKRERRATGWGKVLGVDEPAADHKLGGRHTSATGFKKDTIKYATAFAMGWNVLRVLPEQITSGEAADWLAAHLKGRGISC